MKTRINLTIDPEVVRKGKRIAARQNKSLSQIIENFLKSIPDKDEEPLFMKMVREAKMKGPGPITNREIREEYYESLREKYGL